ncbi:MULTISPECIES: cytochrome P450 [Streptomycetaceae]|uniref:Cytochrome P450 n=1 Tax=Streptantibioticus cattleyicolor (strain ATCC 35852 / DSM 46488 / JCM 4925 / NBRC 14057 / NRRL 8057) TaxID=1003195 RepID=F8JSR9_STREN|nr:MULTISPECIES: cytochrome P450 [Streptomycetaceae]AEW97976.1 cytochrome P450 [Streptantibioticus cattleyicolor NRRL 8057 = DSM 46488]MYS62376.1 cytochrome P450 [Streptomyces sp. SID5468]CCB78293.1 Cytochrome P450 [Streptantibioticus cattleyicolor NRRL 8057 = DSM 46488]
MTAAVPRPPQAPSTPARQAPPGPALIEVLTRAAGHGSPAAFELDGRPMTLVTDPEQVRQVLACRPEVYVKHSHRARALLGDGLITATGDAWKRQRRLLQARFTVTGVRRYEAGIAAAAERIARRWSAAAGTGDLVDVGEDMRFFALDTIWRALTGDPLDEAAHRELAAVDTVVAALPTTAGAPTGDPAEVGAALGRIDATARRVIAAARARRAAHGPSDALLDLLLDASGSDAGDPDRLVRDELVTLLVAGHETTAQTLAWLFLMLHQNIHVPRTSEPGALVAETLRLYPAVWLVPRCAARDDVLGGRRVAAGSGVLVCPYLTHREPAWWPDPERFDPARFLPGGVRPAHPGAYVPFGLGPRACLGQQFALRETAALLARLLPAFTVELRDPPAAPVFGANLRPGGPLPAVVRRRT